VSVSRVSFQVKQFADTETNVIINNPEQILNQDVAIIFKFSRPSIISINDQVIRLFQVVRATKVLQPKSIDVKLSYMPYARDEHEQNSLDMLGTCLHALGVTTLSAVQLHDPSITQSFQVPLHDVTLEDLWAGVIKEKIISCDKNSWSIASPDTGGTERAERVAVLCDVPVVTVQKVRTQTGEPVVHGISGDVHDKNIILIDDILDTGRTALVASQLLRAHGARALYACFTHAVFSEGAVEHLAQGAFDHIFVTDTLVGVEALVSDNVTIIPVKEFSDGTSI